LNQASFEDLSGGAAADNATLIERLLAGRQDYGVTSSSSTPASALRRPWVVFREGVALADAILRERRPSGLNN
jgi:anthranilate phosphoribosyltransferase